MSTFVKQKLLTRYGCVMLSGMQMRVQDPQAWAVLSGG